MNVLEDKMINILCYYLYMCICIHYWIYIIYVWIKMTTHDHLTLRWNCLFLYKFIHFNWRLNILQYCSGFSIPLTWISPGCTCVPHPEPPSHLLAHPIPLGHPSTTALSTLSRASNIDWQSISHMIIYIFQCYSPKSSHPLPLPRRPKDCSIHLCLLLSHI